MNSNKSLIVDVNIGEKNDIETSSISEALVQAQLELSTINETINSVHNLRPECDKTDYILASCSGILCGVFDVFLVGKPKDSIAGDAVDKWVGERIIFLANHIGKKGRSGDINTLSGAINHLANEAKVPYDQTHTSIRSEKGLGLSTYDHHFKSLAHNPSVVGLFFSIVDQFNNTSTFVDHGRLISLQQGKEGWELKGNSFQAKLWCGFVNWLKHLLSDVAGSGSNKGRGMGLPAPFMTWINNIITIRRTLNYPINDFEVNLNEFAIQIYKEGYDLRFQATQAIPVLINELMVRLMYTIRRTMKYISETDVEERNRGMMWERCKPFGNPTIKRMLTVAHGTFCAVDIGDATIRGIAEGRGTFNPVEFVMRVNIVGVGRFAISVVGEVNRANKIIEFEDKRRLAEMKKTILEDYISSLKILYNKYDDEELMTFINNIQNPECYVEEFNKTVQLAKKRNARKCLENKNDIDEFFMGGEYN